MKDIYEIYQMRLIIEPNATRMVAPGLSEIRLREFRAGFAALDPDGGSFLDNFSLDRNFHDFIDALLAKNKDRIVDTITRHILNSKDAALRLDGFLSP